MLPDINLHVEGRIQNEDAERQTITAKTLLERLQHQPGQIIADEVGMGKTFVALATAVSVALQDAEKRPVVVMVPSGLKEKWPKDLSLFIEKCLPAELRGKVKCGTAESNVDFLKLLDDPVEVKKNIIFLTHTALTRSLTDSWLKLAIIQRALYRRRNVEGIYKNLGRFGAKIFWVQYLQRNNDDLIERLMLSSPDKWKKILIKSNSWTEDKDDPVPQQIIDILGSLSTSDFDGLLQVLLNDLPVRDSVNINEKISRFRRLMNNELQPIWAKCLNKLSHSLPLLIMDEAHHLKNGKSRIARLFHENEDEESVSAGQLNNVFERMIFLTATPFQLGHQELCNILDRFQGIHWAKANEDGFCLEHYSQAIKDLRKILDETQESAIRFDNAWSRLKREHLNISQNKHEDIEQWWTELISTPHDLLSPEQQIVVERYHELGKKMKGSENELKKYLVRHLRKKELTGTFKGTDRRSVYPGRSIMNGEEKYQSGLTVDKQALLPFLLAARLSSLNPETRPVFAEGLASSYEAFLFTRKIKNEDATDYDDETLVQKKENSADSNWYLQEIETLVTQVSDTINHPKVNATVQKVIDLWVKGEKVLVFCHYLATGRALWIAISRAMKNWIEERASIALGCSKDEVQTELEKIGSKFDEGYALHRKFKERLFEIIDSFQELSPHREQLLSVITRYFRTPSFLVRFFPLADREDDEILLEKAFAMKDASDLTLENLIKNFLSFLANKCGEVERGKYLDALLSVQSGGIRLGRLKDEVRYEGDDSPENTLPNVRLVTGATLMQTRQNLMLTFNTPFYPDVLIATSVMAEGVDLHLNCRFIIHHDLCWNPSTLEQRTGRVDRIGAKVEQCGKSIHIYHPYIAATQDEKMYKVVMDRARWFNILMGEEYKEDLVSTEAIAERISLPEKVVRDLSFKLEVYNH